MLLDANGTARRRFGRRLHPARDDAPLVIQGGRMAGSGSEGSAATGASAGSTANHGDLSLREIRQQQAERDAARQYEALVLIEKGRGKEADGQPGLAKIYYQQALSRAEGTLREQIEAKIRSDVHEVNYAGCVDSRRLEAPRTHRTLKLRLDREA
jgi:hypothetical protein